MGLHGLMWPVYHAPSESEAEDAVEFADGGIGMFADVTQTAELVSGNVLLFYLVGGDQLLSH